MRKMLGLVMGLILLTFSAMAQRTVTGRVTDEKGVPIPNVSVVIKGTQTGTVTNTEGFYTVTVQPAARILIFSSVDRGSLEVNIGDRSVINASLSTTEQNLEEIVVVGYGTQRRADVTGNVSQISGNKLRDQPIQSFEQGLSGRAAGVNISIPNGVLNNPPVIRVRGVNSISLSSFPLVVIDGVPTFTGNSGGTAANNVLGDINPSDIESMEILKDASAAAIYGSRAAAGVLLITTKKGRQGRPRINYENWVGWTSAYNLIEVLNAQEFTDLKNEGLTNFNQPPNPALNRGFFTMTDANGNLVDTRWYDHIYRTGLAHNHNLNVSGANDRTNYYFSVGYNKTEGMIRRNNLERLTGLFNIDQQVTDWFKVGGKFNYSTNNSEGINTGSIAGTAFNTAGAGRLPLVLAPNVGPYNNDGTYNINRAANSIGQGNNLTALSFPNPVLLLDQNQFTSMNDRIMSNFYGEIKLFRDLRFRTVYGVDYLNTQNDEFRTAEHGDGVQFGGAASATIQRYRRSNWQNLLTYDKRIAQDHSLNVLVGAEQQYSKASGFGADRRAQTDPFFNEFQGGFSEIVPVGNFLGENFLQSYFSRVNYDYKKKYFLSLNGRRDGYSAFAQKWGNFFGGSVGWVVSEEDFWKKQDNSVLSSLKLRASAGQVGNFQGIGDFVSLSTFGAGLYGTLPTLFFANAGNPDLTWEKSNKLDVGFTAGLFKDRLNFEFAYYRNDITDLILDEPQAPSRGIPGNRISTNVGSMKNSGIEVTLSGTVLSKRDFTWTANFNITTLRNEVTKLANNNADILVGTSGLENVSIIRVGQSIGSFYVVRTDGINPANGQRIFVTRDSVQTRIQYNHAAPTASRWTRVADGTVYPRGANQNLDAQVFGPALPKYFGGFENTFRWKGLDLNILMFYSGGNYVYNGTKAGLHDNRNWNSAKDALNRWQKPGDNAKWPRVVFGDNVSNGSGLPMSNNVEKGDFIKARNITLGYTLPRNLAERANLNSVRVYVAAFNAFTFTGYEGFDPEIQTNGNSNGAPSVDRNSVPMARTFNVGLNIGF
jgi:TonB-dependent starch-binding outer membrane protein SusC